MQGHKGLVQGHIGDVSWLQRLILILIHNIIPGMREVSG